MNNKYQLGFGLIDSMIALGIFSVIAVSGIMYFNKQQVNKNAENLANQTRQYAVIFTRNIQHEMRSNESLGKRLNAGEIITLSPNELNDIVWSNSIATKNIFGQTPCLTMMKNNNTNKIEAVMYYVGGKSFGNNNQDMNTVRNANTILGGISGIYANKAVIGNSGWNIATNSVLLQNSYRCGGEIANNSLVINVELLPSWYEFEQNILNSTLLSRGTDLNHGQTELPGHMQNYNTVVTNMGITQGNGIVINQAQNIKLALNNTNSKQSFGFVRPNNNSAIHGSYIKAIGSAKAGDSCTEAQLGEIVLDNGITSTSTALTHSTLTCTASFACPNAVNHAAYCYRTNELQDVVLTNATNGIQDNNGQFRCPASVPFVREDGANTDVTSYINVYVGYNNGSTKSSIVYSLFNVNGDVINQLFNNQPASTNLATGIRRLITLTDTNIASPVISNVAIGNNGYRLELIYLNIGGSVTKIGYSIISNVLDCNALCGKLDTLLGSHWRILGGGDTSVTTNITNGCGCERTDINNGVYNGIAVIKLAGAKLLSVGCTNQPTFTE